MRARRLRPRRALAIIFGASGILLLASCASLGGNVSGSFSCAAPDGTCAPSATIDDRALAAIGGPEEEGDFVRASGSPASIGSGDDRFARSRPVRPAPGDTARTRERVLRIVFQPYIDEHGRLHEATAVHAVVASGDWQRRFASTPANALAPSAITGSISLADAVERADPSRISRALATGDLPAPEAIAAARARKADPRTAIRAGETPGAGKTPAAALQIPEPREAPKGGSAAPASLFEAGAEYPAASAAMGPVGRRAEKAMEGLESEGEGASPAMHAPGFPASVDRDD